VDQRHSRKDFSFPVNDFVARRSSGFELVKLKFYSAKPHAAYSKNTHPFLWKSTATKLHGK
jgi:hypothetical protein